MVISPHLLDEIVAHALRDAPNECCGVVAVRNGAAETVHPLENVLKKGPLPLGFEIDGMALHHVLTEIEDGGAQLGAIYHSHTRSAPYPSQTDINFAAPELRKGPGWPGTEWIIVGTAGSEPEVRSYRIEREEPKGVTVTEVPIT
ncbi:MAG: M67 family metallopeptidase [Actinomycetota bacterium]|nr:M67 family metallopeptidase [Actinomycetota bacterium]